MALFSQSGQILSMGRSTSVMLPVLKLFLLPVGGGIPAGVLLASAKGLAWPITTVLYLVSDMVLALAFEPILRLLAALGRRVPFLARLSVAFKAATARSVAYFSGTGAGPLSPHYDCLRSGSDDRSRHGARGGSRVPYRLGLCHRWRHALFRRHRAHDLAPELLLSRPEHYNAGRPWCDVWHAHIGTLFSIHTGEKGIRSTL